MFFSSVSTGSSFVQIINDDHPFPHNLDLLRQENRAPMFVQAAEEATIGPSFKGVMCQMLQGLGQPLLPRARVKRRFLQGLDFGHGSTKAVETTNEPFTKQRWC